MGIDVRYSNDCESFYVEPARDFRGFIREGEYKVTIFLDQMEVTFEGVHAVNLTDEQIREVVWKSIGYHKNGDILIEDCQGDSHNHNDNDRFCEDCRESFNECTLDEIQRFFPIWHKVQPALGLLLTCPDAHVEIHL